MERICIGQNTQTEETSTHKRAQLGATKVAPISLARSKQNRRRRRSFTLPLLARTLARSERGRRLQARMQSLGLNLKREGESCIRIRCFHGLVCINGTDASALALRASDRAKLVGSKER